MRNEKPAILVHGHRVHIRYFTSSILNTDFRLPDTEDIEGLGQIQLDTGIHGTHRVENAQFLQVLSFLASDRRQQE